MENNPDMESFERFIKQQSDDFRMYPTKRVWYSLYNNLHPGRKWPSISMCIVLLTALFLVGFLNTSNNHNTAAIAQNNKNISGSIADLSAKKLTNQNSNLAINNNQKKVTGAKFPVNTDAQQTISSALQFINHPSTLLAVAKQPTVLSSLQNVNSLQQPIFIADKINSAAEINSAPGFDEIKMYEVTPAANGGNGMLSLAPVNPVNHSKITATEKNSTAYSEEIKNEGLHKMDAGDAIQASAPADKNASASITDEQLSKAAITGNELAANQQVLTNLVDKSWIENYALYNKPAPKKWKGKLAWQAYLTPSVSYRKLFNSAAGKNTGIASGLNGSTDATLSKEVTQSASVGLEGGIGLLYPIFKGVKIKAGFQLNYTRYNIAAFENSHPTITSLEMISEFNGKPYESFKTTAYSNSAGLIPVTLHSQTFQVSLPVGADVKLAGNDLFEWFAGASIQPTFVFGASSYLISTDRRNYVKDNSMLNHFNMNAAFESYISFQSAGGLTWQIGPQLRKQLFSTSSRLYSVQERLVGYGLKVGFVKKL